MRRATGRDCSAGRGALFGALSRPLACAAPDRRANAEARIIVRCAPLARAMRGNHLENIRGTPRKPLKTPRAGGSLQLTRQGTSGQPVGKCKTFFLVASTTNGSATEMTHVGQSFSLQKQGLFPNLSGLARRKGKN